MAKAAASENGDAPFGYKADGTPRKRAGNAGPRKSKPYHVLFRATDADGNAIQGARIEVLVATKDTEVFMDALDQNKDAQRMKLNVSGGEGE